MQNEQFLQAVPEQAFFHMLCKFLTLEDKPSDVNIPFNVDAPVTHCRGCVHRGWDFDFCVAEAAVHFC